MATINAPQLTLRREGSNVRVIVDYTAGFTTFERNLAGLGLTFVERISIIGVDPPGSTTGTVLGNFTAQVITVPASLLAPRHREVVMPRTQLDEDPNTFLPPDVDPDEIRCRIRIEARGLPAAVTPDVFTDQEVLQFILQPITATAASASD